MFCTACGVRIEGVSRFCVQCGQALTAAPKPLQRTSLPKFLSGGGAGVALLCFFLPWITVSCQGMPLSFSFSGWTLAVGTTIENQRVPGEPILFVVLLAAILLIPLSLVARGKTRNEVRNSLVLRGLTSAVPVVLLLYKAGQWNNQVQRQAGGLVRLDYQPWFFLTILAFIAAGIGGFLELREGRKIPSGTTVAEASKVLRTCVRCGGGNPRSDMFCVECGERLTA